MNSLGYRLIHFHHQIVFKNLSPNVLLPTRNFSKSNVHRLKEIVQTTSEDGKTLTVEGVYVASPRENNLVSTENLHQNYSERIKEVIVADGVEESSSKACPLCKLGLEIKHTDVLILSQFIDSNGNQLERKVTGLCMQQHRRMHYLVEMAKLAGILKVPTDPEPTERPGYMKYNKYYEESVIDEFFTGKRKKA